MKIKLALAITFILQSNAYGAQAAEQPKTADAKPPLTVAAMSAAAQTGNAAQSTNAHLKKQGEENSAHASAAAKPQQHQHYSVASAITGFLVKPWKVSRPIAPAQPQLFAEYDWGHGTKTSGVKGKEIHDTSSASK